MDKNTNDSNSPVLEKTVSETMNLLIKKINALEEKMRIYNLNRKEFLSAKETSIYYGLSVPNLYKLAKLKLIPFYKPNKKAIYFKIEEIEEWIRNSRRSSLDNIQEESDKRSSALIHER